MSEDLLNTAIVVVNWNSASDVVSMLLGLPPSWLECVIVVDNASERWDVEQQALAPLKDIHIIRRNNNGGYAAGVNTGMAAARALNKTYAVLINPDARLSGPLISQLVALASLEGHSVVGTAQRGPQGRYTTAALGTSAFPRDLSCSGCDVGAHQVDVVSGAVLVIELSLAKDLGGLDESFFHYAEEVDYCLRVRAAGGTIAWSCATEVFHAVGGSMPHTSKRAHYYTARNKVLLARRHTANWWLQPRLLKDEVQFGVAAFSDGAMTAWARGLIDGVRNISGMWSA